MSNLKPKKNKGGRPVKADKATHRYCVRLTDEENMIFQRKFEDSGLREHSRFLKAVILGRPLKVVKIDRVTMDYYIRLSEFYKQFQAIGNNYNQTVKALKSNFGEKRGLAMLYKLEKATIELVLISKQVIQLTREYEDKWLRK